MVTVGLREIRQHARDLVRRAEAGEEIQIAVSGRPAAMLGPIRRITWRQWTDVAELFQGQRDDDWDTDQDRLDGDVRNPWALE